MIEGRDTSGYKTPLWFNDCIIPTFPTLQANVTTEICIIGAGIAGLTTAYKLLQEGKEVVLLEDGHIVSGESGRTSAHLCNALDDRYYELERVYGLEGTKLIAQSHTAAIVEIEKISKLEGIDCEFKWVNGYLFLTPTDNFTTLEKEQAAASRAGLTVDLLKEGDINQFHIGPVLRFANQAKFHPLKYLTALAKIISEKGGKIFTRTHATELKPGPIVEIHTNRGAIVKAKQVILATNTPFFDKALLFAKQEPLRTYIAGFSIDADNLEDGLFWDTGDPYHYLRFHHVGDQVVLSIGGEDHRVGLDANVDHIFAQLKNWGKQTIPQLKTCHYFWSGQIMEPVDHLAFIGINPTKEQNIFIVSGDSGNGLTHGTAAALLLTDLIMCRENAWSTIYSPTRKPSKNILTFATHNFVGMSQYTAFLTPGDEKNEQHIKPGEGAVIRKGLGKVATYKDEQGKLHYCSAICPHLGGVVNWNPLEKSWDCPVHGSRFTPKGEVMNGPANQGLKQLMKANKKTTVPSES